MSPTILAVNAGSSSLKFKLFNAHTMEMLWAGKAMGIGSASGSFHVIDGNGHNIVSKKLRSTSGEQVIEMLINWIDENEIVIQGIGHRVVHGGALFFEPAIVSKSLIRELKKVEKLAPLHLPDTLSILSGFLKAFPKTLQVASFDTDFHKGLPDYAKFYPVPENVRKAGVQRYGFHGISCQYITGYLRKIDAGVERKKIVIAHLGSGASLTAVLNGKSVDTTMGFTPAGGLMMSSRAGDMDPGIAPFLMRSENLSARETLICLYVLPGIWL